MLSSVLRSARAVQVKRRDHADLVRRLREMLATTRSCAEKIDAMEKRNDRRFQAIFATIGRSWKHPCQAKKTARISRQTRTHHELRPNR